MNQHATCADAPYEMSVAQREAENQAMWFCEDCSEIVINQIIGYQKFETQTKVLTNSIDELRNVKAEMENLVKQTKDLRNSIDELRGVKAEMDNLQKKIDDSTTTLTSISQNIESTEKSVKTFAELFHDDSGESSAESFSRNLAQNTAVHFQKNC